MAIYIIVVSVIFAGLGAVWFIDPKFMNLGYYLYHLFPIFMFIATLFLRNKVESSGRKSKIITVWIFFILWLVGVWYINSSKNT
jgi:hypothetical protein